MISSLTKELNEVKAALSAFVTRVSVIEEEVNIIMSANTSITTEMNSLKEKVHHLESLPIEDSIAELQSRQFKADNVIIQGLPEKESGSQAERDTHDANLVSRVFQEIGVSCEEGFTASDIRRMGGRRGDGSRLLRLKTKTPEQKAEVLRRARDLKNSSTYNNVFIRPDLTPMQLESRRRLRRELLDRRQRGEDVFIFRGRVQCRVNGRNFQ